MHLNDRDLMALRVATLYRFDDRGRMIESNEMDGQPAPRVWLGRTMVGDVVRFGATVPDGVVRRVEALVERDLPAVDLTSAPAAMNAIQEVLAADALVGVEGGGPAYRFPEPVAGPENVVQLTDENRDLVRETFRWLYDELPEWAPGFAVVEDGAAVSVCFSSRIGTDACEAGVETLAGYRGRGYASAVTAAWGAAIRDSGRTPLYSTAWANLASQAVARRVGLVMFGADVTWG